MNIVYCIRIHELLMMYDRTTLRIFLPNRRISFNEIILVNGNNTDFLLYNKQIHYE